jgi:hypothetical protein
MARLDIKTLYLAIILQPVPLMWNTLYFRLMETGITICWLLLIILKQQVLPATLKYILLRENL